jgi:hypothetical protein
MGWKTINGRRYFYKSEWEGGRVKTTYFGAGESGSLMAEWIALERLERAEERERLREEREESDAEDRAISDWFDGVQAVADAVMVAAGFYRHKGQWRRRGDERSRERRRDGRGRDETAGPGPRDPGIAPKGFQGR